MAMRILAAVAVLMLCASAGASGAYIVNADDIAMLVDAQGDALLSRDGVKDIFEIRDGLYAVGAEGAYMLCDATGEHLLDDRFEMAWCDNDALILRQNGLLGAMGADNAWQVKPAWRQLVSNGSGAFMAISADPGDDHADEIFYIRPTKAPVSTGIHTSNGLRPFSEGRMSFRSDNGLYGYLDARGRVALPTVWRYAGDFKSGVAIVSDGESMGLIDKRGEEVVPLQYSWMARGDGILAGLSPDGRLDVYAPDGRLLFYSVAGPITQAAIAGRAVAVTTEGMTKLLDGAGSCVIRASRDALFSPGLGGQYIVRDGAWGDTCQWLIAQDGSAASGRYQRLLPLIGGRYAFMAMSGTEYQSGDFDETLTEWDYDSIRYGLLDASGHELLSAEYREIRAVGDDRLLLTDDLCVRFADLDGNVLQTWPLNQLTSH